MVPSLSFNVLFSRMGGAEEMGEVTTRCSAAHNCTAMSINRVPAPVNSFDPLVRQTRL